MRSLIFVVLLRLGACIADGRGYGGDKDLLDILKSISIEISPNNQKQYATYIDGIKDEDKDFTEEYVYDKNKPGFGISEYDYVQKCNIINKDCSDGRDCYDRATDRGRYDRCKDQYGDEGRYYDYSDRFIGIRYREDDYRDKECYETSKNRDDYDKCRGYSRRCRNSYNIYDSRIDRHCDKEDGNLVGLGRRDREDYIIRPCALDDRQCIRKYLAENSNCKPAFGPIPDPLYLKRSTIYIPNANLTALRTRLRITGLASIRISEFYVNKDTKNLVIALDFQKLNMTTPKAYLRFKRTAKESIVLEDFATGEYQSGTFTAVIPEIPKLRLDLAEVHADIDDIQPPFLVGPKALASTDPDVIASIAKLLGDPVTTTQEAFLFQSQLFTSIYIQENLCDFGLKITSI